MVYSNGGRNQGRGGGRGGRGRGRGRGGVGGRGGPSKLGVLNVCRDFIKGACSRGDSCHYHHVVQLHASVDAAPGPALQSSNYKGRSNNTYTKASVSCIAIWEQQPGQIKIFTGSHDGCWRLWNTAGGQFHQEFENPMNGKINELLVHSNFLFCGFEAKPVCLPAIDVGMCHIWNLQNPSQKPLELRNLNIPYAHNTAVTALSMTGTDPSNIQIVTGSRDGSMRVWKFENNNFVVLFTLMGHAREVTDIIILNDSIWSSGVDNCIRIWDRSTGLPKHCIGPDKNGHSHAITSLVSYDIPNAGTFVISSSLDKTVRAWNSTNGECVHSEQHDEGIVSMCIAKDLANHELLLLGLESGSIMCRTLQQVGNMRSFEALFTLSYHQGVGHNGAVKCLQSGPAATFYSGGVDGKMQVFSFVGDVLAQN